MAKSRGKTDYGEESESQRDQNIARLLSTDIL
jgi:hypothetical protein